MKTQFRHILRILQKFTLLLLLTSCDDPIPEPIDYNEGSGVFILNEGNMTFGNASLSFYDPKIETVKNQVFFNTNEFPVGDVLQSMTIIDSMGYLVINNSGKIFVVNTSTMQHESTIPGLTSPRNMLPVDQTIAYISDLYSDHITMIDLQTYEKKGSIDLHASSEEMLMLGDFVYVCSWSFNNKVYKIAAASHKVSDSLEVCMQPNSMVVDKNNNIWVLSDGGYPGMQGSEAPALTCIDPNTFTISKVIPFSDELSSPTELSINPSGDTIYYINNTSANNRMTNGVFALSIDASEILPAPFIPSNERLFYGLGCDPKTGAIYVSDAIDHIQKGWIFRFTSGGIVLDSFKVDIIPGAFCFKEE